MYKKILWWCKNRPEKPLSYSLIVAAIFAEKCDPEPFFECVKNGFSKETFFADCKKPNLFANDQKGVENAFKSETGINLTDLISSEVWMEIIKQDSIYSYISSKTFESQNEIKMLCEKIYRDYLDETCFLDIKKMTEVYKQRGFMFCTQMRNLTRSVGSAEKWIEGTANTYWFGVNAMRCITERVQNLLKCEQTQAAYNRAAVRLMEYFNFTPLQIEMLKYFFCQSIEGTCPPHLNKAIFIWGDNKGVGKTTIASTIVSILNGEKNINNARLYESDLAQELGWKDFVAPMICSCRAVLMDEAMPKDSSKSYGSFKKRITTDGVKIRFVFQNQIDVQAKANYVFTSNDPLEVFIQDKKERRFLEFHIEKKHNNLSYEQIYNAFLSFAQQCKRTMEWGEWYNSMSKDTEVKGIISRDIEDIRSFFETTSFFTTIELGSSQVSIGEFYRQAQMFDKNASKQTIRECVYEMFGEPMRPSTWRKADILAVLYGIPKDEQKQIDQGELPF
jgi:hypothetical protein